MARRRSRARLLRRSLWWVAALPLAYLLAALAGSLLPANPGWTEPERGTTIYLLSNGIHVDLLLPASAHGLDWRPLLPREHFAAPSPAASHVSFGAGERRVYLETPRWRDLKPRTVWSALTGGERVMHVEWVEGVPRGARELRLRPEEYRRLWAAIRSSFRLDERGRPQRIDHPGYWSTDAFYLGTGRANALATCNAWASDMLRLAGVEASLWSPFAQGLLWRYRRADHST